MTDDFAGVIVEVVQGEGGLAPMTEEFARALNDFCRRSNAILIADEVQTGMGRTGTFYASEGVGLQPDIITLAKPLAGGLPLSAVLISQKINCLIHAGDHGTTFGGGPVTTAVAAQVWKIITEPAFMDHVKEAGTALREGLSALRARHPQQVGDLRGKGLLQGFRYLGGEMKDLLDRARDRGILLLRSGADVVRLAPPLIISHTEIEQGIHMIEEALE